MKKVNQQKDFPKTAHYAIVIYDVYHTGSYRDDDTKANPFVTYYAFDNRNEWEEKISSLNEEKDEVFTAFHVDAVAKIVTKTVIE